MLSFSKTEHCNVQPKPCLLSTIPIYFSVSSEVDLSGRYTEQEPSRKELSVREEGVGLTGLAPSKCSDYWREWTNVNVNMSLRLVRKLAISYICEVWAGAPTSLESIFPLEEGAGSRGRVGPRDGSMFCLVFINPLSDLEQHASQKIRIGTLNIGGD